MNTEYADKWASIYTRVRFADPHTGYVHCYTCTTRLHWTQVDCGHWIGRGNFSVRYHDDNMRPQCHTCNRVLNGLPDVFEEELRAEIGDEGIEALLGKSRAIRAMSEDDIEARIAYMKSTAESLSAYKTVV